MLVLTELSRFDVVDLFRDIEIYITVLVYGAGVDYCLFLIARYKEELDAGATYEEASARSIGKVGAALAASAGTSGVGIGMMAFAEFGKFEEAGVAIFFSLMICLLTALTFAPSIIRLCGKWAFWPYMPQEKVVRVTWISPTTWIGRLMQSGLVDRLWNRICELIRKHPARIWITTALLMVPFAGVGVYFIDNLSYGLLSELPDDYLSVQGARAAQQHFSPGETGPATILLQNPAMDFTDKEVIEEQLRRLSQKIKERKDELDVDDVRSVADPTGITKRAREHEAKFEEYLQTLSKLEQLSTIRLRNNWIHDYYVTQVEELDHSITRIDVVFQQDPFSRNMITDFIEFEEEMRKLVDEFDDHVRNRLQELRKEAIADGVDPEELDPPVEIPPTKASFLGPTASMADLKLVTDRDQIRIEALVLLVVYVILVILLRRIAISFYLLMTVFFTYFVSLGVAYALFYALDPSAFAGLDWKVPLFLFTILIAVGEDYNILLITRIEEEQLKYGHVEGTLHALGKTGSIISSCGIIMAGTFSSLLFGTLLGLKQLGFALAFGVFLDTFVVRPLLVPSWLVMLYRGYFGRFSRFLGAPANIIEPPATEDTQAPAESPETVAESPSISNRAS
jgi:RND superfamily putative drug exporter